METLPLFRQFVALTERKRILEGELTLVKQELDKQKEVLFPVFEENPRLRVSVDGMTVYITHRFAARLRDGSDRARAAEALSAWAPELVKPDFNLNTVSAFLRERVKEQGKEDMVAEIPQALGEFFEIKDWFDINAVSE